MKSYSIRLIMYLRITKQVISTLGNVHLKFYKNVLEIRRLFSSNVEPQTVTLLQDRFIEYFKRNSRYKIYSTNYKNSPIVSSILQYINDYPEMEKQMSHIEISDIPSFFLNICDRKVSLSSRDLLKILKMADNLYNKKICFMNKENVLLCMYAWFLLCEGNFVATKIYNEFMYLATLWMSNRNNKLEHIVLIMFYVGMSKKSSQSKKIIQQCLHEVDNLINHLSLDEMCIICSSSYKCSVKVKSSILLNYICKTIDLNVEKLVNDPAYLVTFMKVLRLAKYHNFEIMDKIANKSFSNEILKLNFTAKVHLLAMYADALYNKAKFVHSLIQSCTKEISTEKGWVALRLKDISRFLWAVSYLGNSLPNQTIEYFSSELQRSAHANYHLQKPEHVISSLLSLWMLGYKESMLYKLIVTEDLMKIVKENDHFRIQARLSLLLTCIHVEKPELFDAKQYEWTPKKFIPSENMKRHLQKRNFLNHVFTAVSNLDHQLALNSICVYSIPHLYILGIEVTSPSRKVLHIEVLDAAVCLHETRLPHGLMKLKLRILQTMGRNVLVIVDNQFDLEKDISEMYVFLEEELVKLHNRYRA